MTNRTTPMAPQQQRSRESMQKLLRATLKVLDESGLAGATVPRIAAAAGMAPASIYRRFSDKEALLRATVINLLTQANDGNREHLDAMVAGTTLPETAQKLMEVLIRPYRAHPQLMRAVKHIFDNETDDDFLDQAQGIMNDNMRMAASTLLTHRKEIKRAKPEQAARLALMHAMGAIEAITIDTRSLWREEDALSDEELVEELAAACVAYLKTR